MKLKIIMLSISLAAICQTLTAQPNFEWAKQLGGAFNDWGNSIAVDNMGNVYTTGTFYGTADFDPGIGVHNLTSVGDWDGFISKFDSSGNFIWAKSFGGMYWDDATAVTLDVSGNVYIVGSFQGTADFNPGVGVYNLISFGYRDVFVVKLDASGNFIWAKQMGGVDIEYGYDIVVDSMGNVYVAGTFGGTADFDPGVGVYNLTVTGVINDYFILKLDASGNFVWVKQFGGGPYYNSVINLGVDAFGNVYSAGAFKGTISFDPGAGLYNLTSAGDNDMFISKLDELGSTVWVIQLGDTAMDACLSMAVDDSGNVYTTGIFKGTIDFDSGQGVYNLTSAGTNKVFVYKVDSSANFVWAKSMSGTNLSYGNSIAIDNLHNVYTTGIFYGTIDFDPGPGTFNLTSINPNYADLFISKLDASGNFGWACQLTGVMVERENSITADAVGNVYTTGHFQDTVDFDPGIGIFNLGSAGDLDVFILKVSNPTTGISENNLRHSITLFPNPTEGIITISTNNASGIDAVIIRDILGKEVLAKNFSSAKKIELTLLITRGVYFAEIISGNNKSYAKVIKE
ncbi:MAG: SBBP repeat-containing protein [Bacteroidia bacterium]|nr:SBBP repeat-containing protein [Bacteroidia bacterium]